MVADALPRGRGRESCRKAAQFRDRSGLHSRRVLFTADLERDFLLHPHRHFSCTPEAVAYVPGDPTKAYDGTSEVLLSNGGVIDLQGHTVKLPVPYSLPPKPYTPECVPWMMKSSRLEPDALGHIICND